ncbi:DUF4140 domain-containing protein [Pseudomonas aeruginosa]
MVTRTARMQLPKGQHEIALEQLPFQLDDTSLRASLGASAAATLSTSAAPRNGSNARTTIVQQLDQQLREIDRQLREIHDRGSVLEAQKKFLADIQSGSTQPGKDRPMPGIDELKSLLQLDRRQPRTPARRAAPAGRPRCRTGTARSSSCRSSAAPSTATASASSARSCGSPWSNRHRSR